MSSLYEIAGQLRELAHTAETQEFDDETIQDTLEGLQGDLTEKADSIAKLVKMMERQQAECELEALRLKDRAKKLEKTAEQVKEYLHRWMRVLEIKKIDNSLFDIRTRKLPPSIKLDEELLEPKYFVERVEQRPDRTRIKADMLAGQEIRGATLVDDRYRLYIK